MSVKLPLVTLGGIVLRILHAMFSKQNGGIERAFIDYQQSLDSKHDTLAILDDNSLIKGQFPDHPANTIRQWNERDPFAIRTLKKHISHFKPDIILTHGNRAGRLLDRANNGTPHVNVLHRYRFKHLDQYDHIICVNKELQRQAISHNMPANKTSVAPNMLPQTERNISARPSNNRFTIGFLGRLVPEKNLEMLLPAIAMSKTKLVIAGGGEDEDIYKALVERMKLKKHVKFMGWQKNLDDFFAQIDCLCLPSHHETFGLAILEAMAYKRPVIATATDGAKSIITHEENGLLIPIDDLNACIDTFEQLASDETLYKKLAESGSKTAESYRPEHILPIIETTLEQVLARGKNR